jgi:hypothetical protein
MLKGYQPIAMDLSDENNPGNQGAPVDAPTPPPPAFESDDLLANLRRSQTAARASNPTPRGFSHWARVLLVCNPFYLVSAALLLCGLYLVSDDAHFPGRETAQLTFNFTALQFYEALLAATAIMLARRRIWYDSTLLVGLENLFVLVPFILVTQAAWLSQTMLWTMCLIAAVMAVARFASLKRFFRELNLPRGLLGAGLVLLAVNVALTLTFHHYNELKIGTKPTDGAAFELNQYSWFLLLPLLVGLSNCLPRAQLTGDLLPQRRGLPTGIFSLWLMATAVHLYCLSYVYNFDWALLFAVPALWALAWTARNRVRDFCAAPALDLALLVPPALITLLAAVNDGYTMFLALTALNIAAYSVCFLKHRTNWLALNLAVLSLGALCWGLLSQFQTRVPVVDAGIRWPVAFLSVYASYWIFRSRNPKLGVLGAVLFALTSGAFVGNNVSGSGLPMQLGLVFLLLHSFSWEDEQHASARAARIFGCSLWVADSLFLLWARLPHAHSIVWTGASVLIAVSVAMRLWRGAWLKPAVPIAATTVLMLHPFLVTTDMLRSFPTGLLAVVGSFLLFGLGTVAALTKSRWLRSATPLSAPIQSTHMNP